ncbi:unnamed protein product [Phaedon cochleariae]|uniref:non-specific serine/threonine protein kinase n=1 Tax=Phaedon cochleariae TaxID=80249 RepID=A0A9P0DD45_PHACE|nr:unnamed protein product [Phaedon cochleariae]
MISEESSELRQRNELEALQAIYGCDIKDLRGKSVWKRWKPLDLSITLTPQQGSLGTQEIYVKVDLHIICNDEYPNSIPKILLENGKGLSNTTLVELQEILVERANEFKGEEMIFQLSQDVQEFLHKHNKPGAKSFYDEMLKRQKEKEEKDLIAKQLEENEQRQYIIEEVKRRQEMLRSETKHWNKNKHQSENDEPFDTKRRFSSSNSCLGTNEEIYHHQKTAEIEFGNRSIQRGCCLEHPATNHIIYCGIDSESGELVIVSEWTIQVESKNDLPYIQRQIGSIEQELHYLAKLKHQNLSHYSGMKYIVNENEIIIYLLREFIMGISSGTFLNQTIRIDMEFLKHISRGVLTALDYLHRNNVIHKYLEASCVYINDLGVVRISCYSIHRRLLDLKSQIHNNYSKKTDIFRFGILVLSLLLGHNVSEENFEIPDSIQSDLYDFLTKCLAKDESDRYTTTQLLNHSFFHKSVIPFSPKRDLEEIEIPRNNSPEIIQRDLQLLSQSTLNGQSRVNNEFEFLQHLGKGAFGDVMKARNKLDGGYYAIKRIQLNPKNKALNKKIVREVKLLSRLNHENVVRYYNSWIETTTIKEDEDASSNDSSIPKEKRPVVVRKDEFTLNDDIELHAPPMKNVEVSITYDSKSQSAYASGSLNESSDEEESWGVIYEDESDSDGIEFGGGSSTASKNSSYSSSIKDSDNSQIAQDIVKQIDFMYIQMEFCEKSTLRTAIDDNLYLNENRVFRLFREIVEGLAHIHQQGMIHRDLKPVNIFLDSEDHVKIGDFGLATTNMKSKQNEQNLSKITLETEKEDTVDESKTGLVGTALYVSPEINSTVKVVYSQKVDIYSLGIILFEMCYRPLETSMERIKILTKLRCKEVTFPDDFVNKKNEKQQLLIRWLLDHDLSKRPTSLELLQSEYIPPPVLEECELRELVRHTLRNPQLKGYKYLIASCFIQPVTAVQDITYDKDPSCLNMMKPSHLHDFVKNVCIKIFKQHGGQNLATPLLMPKSKFYDGVDSYVKLMTHFGGIVSLPHDLRVPFARFVAWNGITLLRRYSIERVYREKKVFGFQPRELYECAFDIVSPTEGSLMSDAEIIYMVCEILNELPGVKNKHFVIRINHTMLLTAILLHCGIKDKHQEIFTMISDVKEGKVPKFQLQNHFITLGLSDNMINMLLSFFYSEFEISKAANQFQMITKKKSGEASQLARQALQDLKKISHNAQAYGVKYDIIVSPGLVYNAQQYSGMIFQFVCELKKKHKHHNMEVLAAGGRYDSMIAFYRSIMENANMLSKEVQQSAIGVSISLDRLVQAVQKEHSEEIPGVDNLDVVVCSVGRKEMIQEKTKILRNLWAAGIRSTLIETTNIEEIQEQLNELKVTHVVILKDNEQGTVRIRSWNKERFQEKSLPTSELVENLQRILRNWNDSYQENGPPSFLTRSESKSSGEHLQEANVDIVFVTIEKLSSNARKRYENQIKSHLDSLFKKLTGFVVVFGLSIESNLIRSLTSFLEFETEYQFQKSVETVIERHPRHKKYLNEICDELYEQKTVRKNPTIVLFSLSDCFYKVII